MNKIYVGNLSYDVARDKLEAVFEKYGHITEAVIIMDRATGQSKGFGFVTFEKSESAEAAVKGEDGKEWEGRKLRVNIARPRD